MKLRLELTYPCEQVLCVCVPGVEKTEVVIRDGGRAQSIPAGFAIREAFGRCNVVPDVDRYRLHMEDGRIALQPHSQCRVAPCSNRYYDHDPIVARVEEKTIVIVLESPHKDEYLRNVGQPIAPAQGVTGSNIQGWFDCVLGSCPALYSELCVESSRLVLVNPVQFQASLASIIKCTEQTPSKRKEKIREKIRDKVWTALWSVQRTSTSQGCEGMANAPSPIRDCFMIRLSTYEPDYIINACTSKLKESVGSFLRRNFQDCKRYEVSHPSSWSRKKSHRKLVEA